MPHQHNIYLYLAKDKSILLNSQVIRTMKKNIHYHLEAIKDTFDQLSKGNFLIYFLPGAIITLFFVFFNVLLQLIFGSPESVTENTGWFATAFTKIGSVVDFILTQIYIFFILTLLSPFNTILSEKLDTKLTGQKFNFSFARLINDFLRMIFIVILVVIMEFFILGIWWFFCWIFNIDDTIIYKIITFLIGAFFFGFSFYDHSLERYEVNVFGSIGFAFSNILMLTITGTLFKLLYYFPYFWEVSYIGIIIAPVITTMISTIVYLRFKNKYPQTNN